MKYRIKFLNDGSYIETFSFSKNQKTASSSSSYNEYAHAIFTLKFARKLVKARNNNSYDCRYKIEPL